MNHYTDCDPDRQKRDISTQVFDIGNTQINTVYELQNTVQLLSDKVNSQSFMPHISHMLTGGWLREGNNLSV